MDRNESIALTTELRLNLVDKDWIKIIKAYVGLTFNTSSYTSDMACS